MPCLGSTNDKNIIEVFFEVTTQPWSKVGSHKACATHFLACSCAMAHNTPLLSDVPTRKSPSKYTVACIPPSTIPSNHTFHWMLGSSNDLYLSLKEFYYPPAIGDWWHFYAVLVSGSSVWRVKYYLEPKGAQSLERSVPLVWYIWVDLNDN